MVIECYFEHNLSMSSRYSQIGPFPKERNVLGKTIEKLRKSKELTQEDLADKADMNVSYLAKIENGYINTTLKYLIKISRGLDVQAKDLFEF